MINRLDVMEQRLAQIDEKLSSSSTSFAEARELNKERATMEEACSLYKEYKNVLSQLEEANLMKEDEDEELAMLGKEEANRLEALKEELYKKMEVALLPKDANDDKNVVMEIRGAVGGEEADLFAGDLYRMYLKYADSQRWKVQLIDESPTSLGGYSQVSFMIKGKGVYSKLKFESGSHRVQRVPRTETSGRIHTSTATVLVMPEVETVDVEINPADLEIDTYRSQGAGGQNDNKTESAVRITHKPSGIVVTCQVERSQIQNREIAMQLLRSRLKAKIDEEQNEKIGKERRLKVGTGERSEKIRTYNFPQNRVTDHRIGYTVNSLDRILEGDLNDLISALIEENQKDLILEASKNN